MGTIDYMSRGPYHNIRVLGFTVYLSYGWCATNDSYSSCINSFSNIKYKPKNIFLHLWFFRVLFSIFDFKSLLHPPFSCQPLFKPFKLSNSCFLSEFAMEIKNKMCAKSHCKQLGMCERELVKNCSSFSELGGNYN